MHFSAPSITLAKYNHELGFFRPPEDPGSLHRAPFSRSIKDLDIIGIILKVTSATTMASPYV